MEKSSGLKLILTFVCISIYGQKWVSYFLIIGACSSQNNKTAERDDELWLEKYKPKSEVSYEWIVQDSIAVITVEPADNINFLLFTTACKRG